MRLFSQSLGISPLLNTSWQNCLKNSMPCSPETFNISVMTPVGPAALAHFISLRAARICFVEGEALQLVQLLVVNPLAKEIPHSAALSSVVPKPSSYLHLRVPSHCHLGRISHLQCPGLCRQFVGQFSKRCYPSGPPPWRFPRLLKTRHCTPRA